MAEDSSVSGAMNSDMNVGARLIKEDKSGAGLIFVKIPHATIRSDGLLGTLPLANPHTASKTTSSFARLSLNATQQENHPVPRRQPSGSWSSNTVYDKGSHIDAGAQSSRSPVLNRSHTIGDLSVQGTERSELQTEAATIILNQDVRVTPDAVLGVGGPGGGDKRNSVSVGVLGNPKTRERIFGDDKIRPQLGRRVRSEGGLQGIFGSMDLFGVPPANCTLELAEEVEIPDDPDVFHMIQCDILDLLINFERNVTEVKTTRHADSVCPMSLSFTVGYRHMENSSSTNHTCVLHVVFTIKSHVYTEVKLDDVKVLGDDSGAAMGKDEEVNRKWKRRYDYSKVASAIATGVTSVSSTAYKTSARFYAYATSHTPKSESGLNEEDDLQLRNMINSWDVLEGDSVHEEIKDRLVVAVMGRVSAGKSTLMKALLQIDPGETDILKVSALSGTTKEAQAFLWQFEGGQFVILDFPGFQEVFDGRSDAAKHFDKTIQDFFKYGVIDVGIYVANGVPDGSQKQDFEKLAKYSSEIFLVRSKADDLETFSTEGRAKVIAQWQEQFNMDKIYLTKIIGYDPDSIDFPNAKVEGVDELRNDMYEALKNKKKGAMLDILKNGIKNTALGDTAKYIGIGLAVLVTAVMKAR
eukprot:CFRG8219T1